MKIISQYLILFHLALLTTGCEAIKADLEKDAEFFSQLMPGNKILASVSAVTAITDDDKNKTFIFPKQLSLLDKTYAASISKRLQKKGFKEASSFEDANYIIVFEHQVSGPTQYITSSPDYDVNVDPKPLTGAMNTYDSGIKRVGTSVNTYSMYTRKFELSMYTVVSREEVYKVSVSSTGTNGTFDSVSECMFSYALDEFPMRVNRKYSRAISRCK